LIKRFVGYWGLYFRMKTIIYIPMIYRGDKGLCPPTTPSCWYYRWQKKLWHFFDSIPYNIIWKAGPRTSNLEDPIKYLKQNIMSENIKYSTKKLSRELKKADYVIVDFPSTPMSEAQRIGKKVFCVTPSWDFDFVREEHRKDMVFVNNEQEAVEEIMKFISEN